jgi:type III restriction enzyme
MDRAKANAPEHARSNGGNPWRYPLIPHDEIPENITLDAFVQRFSIFQ